MSSTSISTEGRRNGNNPKCKDVRNEGTIVMQEQLFTGAFSLPDPDEPERRQFGMVAGWSQRTDVNGTVKVSLRHKDTGIYVEFNESAVDIEMPEAQARIFARV